MESKEVKTSTYTKSEAMDLLKSLRESNSAKDQKLYRQIQKAID